MANSLGVIESFAPGTEEYKRVTFDLSKDKYYKPSRTSLLLLSGFGNIPGSQLTNDQKKATVSFDSKVLDQMEFEILTHNPRVTQTTKFVTGTLTTGTYGTAGTYTVDDASILRPYDVIINATTGELLLVTAVDTTTTPDQITAYPGFSQTGFSGLTAFPWTLSNATPQTKTDQDVIRVVGTAFPEGSTAGNIIDTRPTAAVNYMQTFREEFGVTYEYAQTAKNGLMELADKDERALGDLLIKMEKALVEGKINKQAATAGTIRTMQGVKGTISTYNQAATALTGGGADLTIPKLDQILNQISGANTSGKVVALCSGTTIQKMRELMENKGNYIFTVGQEDFGIKALRYEDAFLPVDFVRHDIFDATGNTDQIMFIDPSHFTLCNLRGCEIGKVSDKRNVPGGTANNDTMALKDAHYGVYSLEYRHEDSNALITGLTYTISS